MPSILESGAAAVFTGPDPLITHNGQPGRALPVPEGHLLGGTWKQVSGAHPAEWYALGALVFEVDAHFCWTAATEPARGPSSSSAWCPGTRSRYARRGMWSACATAAAIDRTTAQGLVVTEQQGGLFRGAVCYVAEMARELVSMYDLGGSSPIDTDSRLGRSFRDGMAAAQHMSVAHWQSRESAELSGTAGRHTNALTKSPRDGV